MSDQGCTFCRIIDREIPAYIIDENERVIVFLSLANHPLVVTREHIPDIYAMPDEVGAAVMEARIGGALGRGKKGRSRWQLFRKLAQSALGSFRESQ